MAAANMDVVWEILLHLPVQFLLRCRGVCKLWRDVIDSPSFRKLHTATHDDNQNDTVYLELKFLGDDNDLKLSMDMIDIKRGKLLSLKHDFNDAMPNLHLKPLPEFMNPTWELEYEIYEISCNPTWELEYDILWFDTAVKGLICFNFTKYEPKPISVCNPFLGEMRTLPIPHNPCGSFTSFNRRAAIGFDDDSGYYKVLQMSYCGKHHGIHARLYSTRTDSWRDLDGNNVVLDRDIVIRKSIISLPCNNGYFAHWEAKSYQVGGNWEPMILTFDMKNEVFRSIALPNEFSPNFPLLEEEVVTTIIAKDEYSFDLIVTPTPRNANANVVRIYESSMCEGNGKLRWNFVVQHKEEGVAGGMLPPLWRFDYVVLKIPTFAGEFHRYFYDYRARKFIRCLKMLPSNSEILAYNGTFISP